MPQSETQDQILRALRNAEKPALSASDPAEKLDVSIKTVNTNISPLTEQGDIATTQLGNATVYYLESSDLPAHQKPDHTCARCCREVNDNGDIAKVDLTTYFDGHRPEPGLTDFYILCRFCQADLVSWLYNDDNAMGEYAYVHSWNIPRDQLEAVRENPEITSSPGDLGGYVKGEFRRTAYGVFQELVDDPDEEIQEAELKSRLRDELSAVEAKRAFEWLESSGYFYRNMYQGALLPAK